MKHASRKLRSILKLLRLEHAPTGIVDPAAAGLLVLHLLGTGSKGKLVAVICASFFLYSGGMVLNDLAHIRRDRDLHPDRPLPSGRVSAGTAYILAGLLLFLGLISAFLVGKISAGIAGFIVFGIIMYNYDVSTHPVWGPALMALLRTGNYLLGLSVAGQSMIQWTPGLALALFVGFHVFFITLISILEESPESPLELKIYAFGDVGLLLFLGLFLLLLPVERQTASTKMVLLGFLPLMVYFVRFLLAVRTALYTPAPRTIGRIIGTGIQGLIFIHATVVAVLLGPIKGFAFLLLLIPMYLSRWMGATNE